MTREEAKSMSEKIADRLMGGKEELLQTTCEGEDGMHLNRDDVVAMILGELGEG